MSFEKLCGGLDALLGQLSIPYNHKWDNQILPSSFTQSVHPYD